MRKTTPTAAIARLRRILAELEELPGEDIAQFVGALRRYEQEAPIGVSLEEALGLAPRPGERTWWRAEEQRRRDETLRQVREQFYPDLGLHAAAKRMAAELQRLERTRSPPSDERRRLLARARDMSRSLGARRIASIIERTAAAPSELS